MRVLIGVSASIAAYKAAEVVSELRKTGADVTVVMTKNATNLIGPATFRSLSGNEVRIELFEGGTASPLHIDLATSQDVVAVIPATANIIGKAASGICDDLLSTVLLSTRAPVVFAPAMNEAMWYNPAVQENVAKLKQRGCVFVEPGEGWLACGKEGVGRLADTETLIAAITDAAGSGDDLKGKRIIVTGGPTIEPIDDVRFISNRSSGKMAAALARAAVRRGAQTVLVMGPARVPLPAGAVVVRVETTGEMERALSREWDTADCVIMAAAVCDFRVQGARKGKIKRERGLRLDLEPTADILQGLGRDKGKRVLVGFAVETENEVEAGKAKLTRKNLDLIMVNNPLRQGSGFGSDTNSGYLIRGDGTVLDLPLMSKIQLAERILDEVAARLCEGAR
jgi:phosphopantothenoylcysteine decarboxylase/phosphopantothenate--cysteine ligase